MALLLLCLFVLPDGRADDQYRVVRILVFKRE
jgi:hypothetical protein